MPLFKTGEPAPIGTWEVTRLLWSSQSKIKRYLADGWEPFGYFYFRLYLRRIVKEVDRAQS